MTTTTTKSAEAPEMPIAERLEHCAKFTGLDAVRELLIEAAAAVRKRDAVVKLLEGELQDRAQPQGEPVAWCIEAQVDDEWFVQYPITFTKQAAELDASLYTPETVLRIRPLAFGDTTPQPAQATQAEVTGEREAFESCALMEGSLFKRRADDPDKYWDGNVQDDWELWQARAILTLRHERVPMTDEEIGYWYSRTPSNFVFSHFKAAIRSAEAHHDIAAQAKKETP
jgi:hypothetical protein